MADRILRVVLFPFTTTCVFVVCTGRIGNRIRSVCDRLLDKKQLKPRTLNRSVHSTPPEQNLPA